MSNIPIFKNKRVTMFVLILIITACNTLDSQWTQLPRVFLYNPHDLVSVKQQLLAGDKDLLPAFQKLLNDADQSLKAGPYSVTYKPFIPPSGDKHDYMSLAPYWWPNPNTKDGLPYIRKDGLVNPERNQYDKIPLRNLESHVTTLALAYFFSDSELYAKHASKLIKIWFLENETKMNPHLEYGQAIPGITKGRGIGIIDTRAFFLIADAIGLIDHSQYWTKSDQDKMVNWFSEYLEWLLHSEHGKDEVLKENNHGTWYDVLASHLSLFTNKDSLAKSILANVPEKRIAIQIEPDGKQPRELSRTRAFTYSSMNLQGLFSAAILGEHVGLDIWHYSSGENPSLQTAFDFLIPYAVGEKEWPYQMIRGWEDDLETMCFLLRIAAEKYQTNTYEQLITKLPNVDITTSRLNLVYPKKEYF